MTEGYIHSVETFGSVDGPGVRFVIFLQGCAMRCRFCHNADTWQTCIGERQTAEQLLDRAERYRSYWGNEGGITVSGGEPLLQTPFVTELFTEAKKRGISTCLDSALQPFTRQEPYFSQFASLMQVTDLILADIKHIDREAHIGLTGLANDNILDGFRYLDEIGKPIWIRQVLVPGLTDDEGSLRRTRQFIETLHNVKKIEVLPYHSMGAYKWEKLGIPYTLNDVDTPSAESVRKADNILNGKEEEQDDRSVQRI